MQTNERTRSEILALRKFAQALSHAQTTEEVFAFGLNAVQDIYCPDRAFVSMPEIRTARVEKSLGTPKTERSSSFVIPVFAGDCFAGKFVLSYQEPRDFLETDLDLAATIAALTGLVLLNLQDKRQRAEITAMAVHELRSPLTAVLGGALLIKSGSAVDRALEMITRNARLQEKLIEDLLSVSQIDTGKIALHMTTVDLLSLLAEVIDEVRLVAMKDGTSIQPVLNGPLCVRGDAHRLRQIFSNLLTNAVRYASPRGEVHVEAVVADNCVQVSIVDNGIGISKEDLPHVFERFRQVRPSHPKAHQGLGLGLAIVDNLVRLHGGSISADSQGLGKGSRFRVRLSVA